MKIAKFKVGDLVCVSNPEQDIDGDLYKHAIGLCIEIHPKKNNEGRATALLLIGEEKVGFFMSELVKYVHE